MGFLQLLIIAGLFASVLVCLCMFSAGWLEEHAYDLKFFLFQGGACVCVLFLSNCGESKKKLFGQKSQFVWLQFAAMLLEFFACDEDVDWIWFVWHIFTWLANSFDKQTLLCGLLVCLQNGCSDDCW